MGSAASTDRAERRRRDRALGHSDASTAEALGATPEDTEAAADLRRKGCKVSPEPKEGEEPAPPQPGSPSFRIYCQDTGRVDDLVAASDAEDDRNEPARPTAESTGPAPAPRTVPIASLATKPQPPVFVVCWKAPSKLIFSLSSSVLAETTLAIRTNDLPHGSSELLKPKESSGWLNSRGLAIVDKMYGLFICRGTAASAHHPHHPPAAVAAKHHHSSAALPPRRSAPVPFI